MWLWALMACNPVCGTAEFTIGGTGAALFDVDSDGDADLTERCGVLGGSFGFRRLDHGLSQLLLDAGTDANGRIDFAISTYVLPVADVWFLSSHLAPGTTLGPEALAGSGIHIPGGEPSDLYSVFPYSGGTLEVLDTRTSKDANKIWQEDEDPVDWRLSWDLEFGDGAQRWVGEDWVQFTNGSDIGDPGAFPPDYTGN